MRLSLQALDFRLPSEDFYRVCFSMDVLDTNGRTGIPRGQIALLFQAVSRRVFWLHPTPSLANEERSCRVRGLFLGH